MTKEFIWCKEEGRKNPKQIKYSWTVFNSSPDFCSQMYLLHAYSPCAGVHPPCSLRIAGLLPTSSTACATSFPGCWALLHWVVWSHLQTDRSPISGASPNCTSLIAFFLPGTIWSHPVSHFPPGRSESLFWASFIVCQELAVASIIGEAWLLVDHCCLSLLNLALYAEKCWDRTAGKVRGSTLLLIVFNLTSHLCIELFFSRFYKTRAVPNDRGVKAKEFLTGFDHVSLF